MLTEIPMMLIEKGKFEIRIQSRIRTMKKKMKKKVMNERRT